jgi:peptidoglycan/xylan/chitin deacetylase (PgdA/CDA1 family)
VGEERGREIEHEALHRLRSIAETSARGLRAPQGLADRRTLDYAMRTGTRIRQSNERTVVAG